MTQSRAQCSSSMQAEAGTIKSLSQTKRVAVPHGRQKSVVSVKRRPTPYRHPPVTSSTSQSCGNDFSPKRPSILGQNETTPRVTPVSVHPHPPVRAEPHPFYYSAKTTPYVQPCPKPRPTPFLSKLLPPSSTTRPHQAPPSSCTPSCHRPDGVPLTLPADAWRSGGALRNSCHRSTIQQRHTKARVLKGGLEGSHNALP